MNVFHGGKNLLHCFLDKMAPECISLIYTYLFSRLTFSLGEGVNLAVGVYVLARTATKPPAVRLYRDNNEPVRTKTRYFHTHNGGLLLPNDMKRAQVQH